MEMFNRSILDEVRVDRMQFGDAQQPCLAIAYSLAPVAGELPTSQVDKVTVTISPTGGTGSKLVLTLKRYLVDETGATLSTTTNTFNGATYTTLKKLIAAINAISGFTAWALHCPHAKSTNSDDFITLAETEIRTDGQPIECLYRDASEDLYVYARVGNPTARDSGRMRLLKICGTQTGVTAGTMKVSRDDYDEGNVPLLSFPSVTVTESSHLDHDVLKAATYRGPLLVELYASDLSVSDTKILTMQAEY